MANSTVTLKEMARLFRRAANVEKITKIVESALNEQAPTAVRGVRQCFDTQSTPEGEQWPALKYPRPGESDLGQALLDTGRLRASIVAVAVDLTLYVGTNRLGGKLMHYGGVVVPKNAKYLCIPTTREAKAAGSPRNFPGLLIPRIGQFGGVLLGEAGSNEKPTAVELSLLEVQYYMTKKVTIPSRRFCGYSAATQFEIMYHVRLRVMAYITRGET